MNLFTRLPLTVLIPLVLLISCSGGPESTSTAEKGNTEGIVALNDAQLKNASIKTSAVRKQAIHSILRAHGLIDVPPQNLVSISVPLGGYLKESHLLPGSRVRKGETIAVIEDKQYIELQQEYLTALSRLGFVEEEYKRQRDLNLSKATSDKVFQQASADYAAQKINVKALAEKLKLIGIDPSTLNDQTLSKSIKLSSPINGYVTKVNVNTGKYVRPEDVLFELVNPVDLHLDLKVFEKDIADIFIGQDVTAFTNNRPDRKYSCEVILIGKEVTEEHSVEVHCHFKNADPALIPGLYMNAEMPIQRNEAYVLPADAVVRHNDKSYVFKPIGNNRFQLVEVKAAPAADDLIEITWITAEPTEGEQFVTEGAYTLLMAMMNVAE